jgi:hypothetical protein
MKEILIYFSRIAVNYSKSLKKESLLVNKPWALLDDDKEVQKLIFKPNKELILSKNGNVKVGAWDYFPDAKSLLIDRVSDKMLLNEQYVDENVIILKKDGTHNDFFALANENTIPDYNIPKYLDSIKNKMFYIAERRLINGNTLLIHNLAKSNNEFDAKNNIAEALDDNRLNIVLQDGRHLNKSREFTYLIKNNKVENVFENALINTIEGTQLEIESGACYFHNGNINKRITINGEPIKQEKIITSDHRILILKNSIILEIKYLKIVELQQGYTVKIEQAKQGRIRKGDVIIDSEPEYPIPDGEYKVKGSIINWIGIKDCVVI